MKVLKFGGTSLATAMAIRQVSEIVKKEKQAQEGLIVVVSAINKTTDILQHAVDASIRPGASYLDGLETVRSQHLEMAQALLPDSRRQDMAQIIAVLTDEAEKLLTSLHIIGELSVRAQNQVLSIGERLSSAMVVAFLDEETRQARLWDARDIIITQKGKPHVDLETTRKHIHDNMDGFRGIGVLAGFIASDCEGTTTNLGRGGSDYTAALLAEALGTASVDIWTDVDGIYTANPKVVRHATIIHEISYEEALELSHFGAGILYPPAILPALRKKIPVRIKNTWAPEKPGTRISQTAGNGKIVKGFSYIDNISQILIIGAGMVGVSGIASRTFSALSLAQVNVVFISQSSSEHSICIGVATHQGKTAEEALRDEFEMELATSRVENVQLTHGFAVIAAVGNSMIHTPGVSGKMFSTLGRNGINVHAIAQGASERNISAIIKTVDARKALNVLHEQFFLSEKRHIHLFVAGTGKVGRQFLRLLKQQHAYLYEEHNLDFRLIGLTNSRQSLVDPEGIPCADALNTLEKHGQKADLAGFVAEMERLNLRNTIFVDNTASEQVSQVYEKVLAQAVSIATCNKIAASSAFLRYKLLKESAKRNNVQYLYETNVGAGLPLLSTLDDLRKTGDKINRIDAVLSGTMNFLFNEYARGKGFYEALQDAAGQGFTEPDPRVDLMGVDVKRKILIMARQAGYELDLEEVKMKEYLPESCLKSESLDEFMQALQNSETFFSDKWKSLIEEGKRLRMVAVLENGKAFIEVQAVGREHPAFELHGADNIILLKTRWYNENPLVIKGAGAGAEVTASGVLNDVIKIANA